MLKVVLGEFWEGERSTQTLVQFPCMLRCLLRVIFLEAEKCARQSRVHGYAGLGLQPSTCRAEPPAVIPMTKEMPASANEAKKMAHLWCLSC